MYDESQVICVYEEYQSKLEYMKSNCLNDEQYDWMIESIPYCNPSELSIFKRHWFRNAVLKIWFIFSMISLLLTLLGWEKSLKVALLMWTLII